MLLTLIDLGLYGSFKAELGLVVYYNKDEAEPLLLVESALYLGGFAGLGGSFGCAVRLETRRSQVHPQPRLATFFRGD